MSPVYDFVREELDVEADRVQSQYFLDGSGDAAFGVRPRYSNSAYMDGYWAKVKKLPKDPKTGEILYGSTAFRTGGYDDPTPGKWVDDF